MKYIFVFFVSLFMFQSCSQKFKLKQVTYLDFEKFVNETNYVTTAEIIGSSYINISIREHYDVEGITWKCPNGYDITNKLRPVTQVSFVDAYNYCKWANVRLPTYEEYFRQKNLLRGVWEITDSWKGSDIRLAGGSYLCNQNCRGWEVNTEKFVSDITSNVHIGFSIIE